MHYLGTPFELNPADVVDCQGFAHQLEGICVLTEDKALLLGGCLVQPQDPSQQPFDLAHPVANHSDL